MSLPFGDTGVGKMGEMPPTSQELSAMARIAKPSARAPLTTRWKYIDGRNRAPPCATNRPDRIQTDCGRSPKASLRRRVQSQPVGRMPALRITDGALHRPLPQLRLQAMAVER